MKKSPNDKFEEYLKSQQDDDYIKRLIEYAKNGIPKFPLTKPDIHKGIGAILYCVVYCLIDNEILGTLFGAFVFIICFVGVVALSIHPTGEYEYKVTIDDTVSLNEFNEKYEITDQEGKIYTIRFKE